MSGSNPGPKSTLNPMADEYVPPTSIQQPQYTQEDGQSRKRRRVSEFKNTIQEIANVVQTSLPPQEVGIVQEYTIDYSSDEPSNKRKRIAPADEDLDEQPQLSSLSALSAYPNAPPPSMAIPPPGPLQRSEAKTTMNTAETIVIKYLKGLSEGKLCVRLLDPNWIRQTTIGKVEQELAHYLQDGDFHQTDGDFLKLIEAIKDENIQSEVENLLKNPEFVNAVNKGIKLDDELQNIITKSGGELGSKLIPFLNKIPDQHTREATMEDLIRTQSLDRQPFIAAGKLGAYMQPGVKDKIATKIELDLAPTKNMAVEIKKLQTIKQEKINEINSFISADPNLTKLVDGSQSNRFEITEKNLLTLTAGDTENMELDQSQANVPSKEGFASLNQLIVNFLETQPSTNNFQLSLKWKQLAMEFIDNEIKLTNMMTSVAFLDPTITADMDKLMLQKQMETIKNPQFKRMLEVNKESAENIDENILINEKKIELLKFIEDSYKASDGLVEPFISDMVNVLPDAKKSSLSTISQEGTAEMPAALRLEHDKVNKNGETILESLDEINLDLLQYRIKLIKQGIEDYATYILYLVDLTNQINKNLISSDNKQELLATDDILPIDSIGTIKNLQPFLTKIQPLVTPQLVNAISTKQTSTDYNLPNEQEIIDNMFILLNIDSYENDNEKYKNALEILLNMLLYIQPRLEGDLTQEQESLQKENIKEKESKKMVDQKISKSNIVEGSVQVLSGSSPAALCAQLTSSQQDETSSSNRALAYMQDLQPPSKAFVVDQLVHLCQTQQESTKEYDGYLECLCYMERRDKKEVEAGIAKLKPGLIETEGAEEKVPEEGSAINKTLLNQTRMISNIMDKATEAMNNQEHPIINKSLYLKLLRLLLFWATLIDGSTLFQTQLSTQGEPANTILIAAINQIVDNFIDKLDKLNSSIKEAASNVNKIEISKQIDELCKQFLSQLAKIYTECIPIMGKNINDKLTAQKQQFVNYLNGIITKPDNFPDISPGAGFTEVFKKAWSDPAGFTKDFLSGLQTSFVSVVNVTNKALDLIDEFSQQEKEAELGKLNTNQKLDSLKNWIPKSKTQINHKKIILLKTLASYWIETNPVSFYSDMLIDLKLKNSWCIEQFLASCTPVIQDFAAEDIVEQCLFQIKLRIQKDRYYNEITSIIEQSSSPAKIYLLGSSQYFDKFGVNPDDSRQSSPLSAEDPMEQDPSKDKLLTLSEIGRGYIAESIGNKGGPCYAKLALPNLTPKLVKIPEQEGGAEDIGKEIFIPSNITTDTTEIKQKRFDNTFCFYGSAEQLEFWKDGIAFKREQPLPKFKTSPPSAEEMPEEWELGGPIWQISPITSMANANNYLLPINKDFYHGSFTTIEIIRGEFDSDFFKLKTEGGLDLDKYEKLRKIIILLQKEYNICNLRETLVFQLINQLQMMIDDIINIKLQKSQQKNTGTMVVMGQEDPEEDILNERLNRLQENLIIAGNFKIKNTEDTKAIEMKMGTIMQLVHENNIVSLNKIADEDSRILVQLTEQQVNEREEYLGQLMSSGNETIGMNAPDDIMGYLLYSGLNTERGLQLGGDKKNISKASKKPKKPVRKASRKKLKKKKKSKKQKKKQTKKYKKTKKKKKKKYTKR